MATVKMYTKPTCPFCNGAKELLDDLDQPYEDVNVEENPEERKRVSEENGNYPTVPMIFINGKFIGGHSDLVELQQNGKLQEMLKEEDNDAESPSDLGGV